MKIPGWSHDTYYDMGKSATKGAFGAFSDLTGQYNINLGKVLADSFKGSGPAIGKAAEGMIKEAGHAIADMFRSGGSGIYTLIASGQTKLFRGTLVWVGGFALVAPAIKHIVGPLLESWTKSRAEFERLYKGIITKLSKADVQDISFSDVIGQKEAKETAEAIARRFKEAKVFEPYFRNDPKGKHIFAVMDGPPGTGKTQLFKATANDVWKTTGKNTLVIKVECDKLAGAADGVGPRAFDQGTDYINKSPEENVLMLLDEIDSLGSRDNPHLPEGKRDTINAFLKMTDGVTSFKNKNIAWFCATNKYENLDPAIHSRVGERLRMHPPTPPELEILYNKYIKDKGLTGSFNSQKVLEASKGFVGRDVETTLSLLKRKLLHQLDPKLLPKQPSITWWQWLWGSNKPAGVPLLTFKESQLLEAIQSTQAKKLEIESKNAPIAEIFRSMKQNSDPALN